MRSWGREAGGRKAAVEQGCFKVFLGPLRSLLFSDLWALLQMKSSAASASEPLIIKEPGPTLRLWSLHDLSDDATFLQLGSLPPSSLDPAPLFSLLSITLMPCRVSWGCAQRSMSLPFPPHTCPFLAASAMIGSYMLGGGGIRCSLQCHCSPQGVSTIIWAAWGSHLSPPSAHKAGA